MVLITLNFPFLFISQCNVKENLHSCVMSPYEFHHSAHPSFLNTVPTFNTRNKCVGSPGIINASRPDAIQFLGHGCMNYPTTEGRFDSQATWVIGVLDSFLYRLSGGVCTPDTDRRPVDCCRN